jgi:uncharacterized protein
MIPMRDGVKLHAVILKPADIAAPLPILIQRTPYGVDGTNRASFFCPAARAGARRLHLRLRRHSRPLQERGQVRHDAAARRSSRPQGNRREHRHLRHRRLAAQKRAGNNGRAGFIGTSYPGFLAMMAGIDPHPAVKAISPQAPMIDVWMGDDFFHNGAFRQSYGYDYVLGMESSKEETEVSYGKDKDGKPATASTTFSSAAALPRT